MDRVLGSAACQTRDARWMRMALSLATRSLGRVAPNPAVGAVLVRNGRVLGRGATADGGRPHAEAVALEQARLRYGAELLMGATAYVTLEPCTMCAGAMVHARIAELVFAAREPKAGVVCSTCSLLEEPWYNHKVNWVGDILARESSSRLQAFFQLRRKSKSEKPAAPDSIG